MGSRRLPGKTLRPILGRPLLHYVIERLKAVELADAIVLAAPDSREDAVLRETASLEGVKFFAGPVEDVLERYRGVAVRFGFDHVVRGTGDNPLVDPMETDRLIRYHLDNDFDYSENFTVLPDGVGLEVFTVGCLHKLCELSQEPYQREGVNDYIFEHPSEFKRGTLGSDRFSALAAIGCTVDTAAEFVQVDELYRELYRDDTIIPTIDALRFLAGSKGPVAVGVGSEATAAEF